MTRMPGSAGRLSVLLALGTCFTIVGQGAAAPVLPEYMLGFGVGAVGLAWAVSAYAVGRLLVTVPTGLIAHRASPRLVLTGGCALTAMGVAGTGLANSFPLVLASRCLAGIGSGVYMTSAILTIVATAPPGHRAKLIGFNQTALLGAVSIAPAVGALLAEALGLSASFIIVGSFSALGAVLVWFLLPWALGSGGDGNSETDSHARPADAEAASSLGPPSDPAPGRTPRQPGSGGGTGPSSVIWPAFIVASIVNLMVFATRTGARQTILPLLGVDRFSMSVGSLGALFTMMSIVSLIVLPVASWTGDRFGRVQTIAPALVLSAAGLFLCAAADSMTLLWLGSAGMAAGVAFAGPAPAAWAADVSPDARHGLTLSVFRTAGDVGSMIGPVALGAVSAWSSLAGALQVHAVTLIALGMLTVIVGVRAAKRVRLRAVSVGGAADGQAS